MSLAFPDGATRVIAPLGTEKFFAARASDGRVIYMTFSDLSAQFVTALTLNNYQPKLVNGLSIKTVGGVTLMGEGDVPFPIYDGAPSYEAEALILNSTSINIPITITSGSAIINGIISTNTAWKRTNYIKVKAGYTYALVGNSSAINNAFYTSEKIYISNLTNSKAWIAPNDGFVILSSNNITPSIALVTDKRLLTTDIDETFEGVAGKVAGSLQVAFINRSILKGEEIYGSNFNKWDGTWLAITSGNYARPLQGAVMSGIVNTIEIYKPTAASITALALFDWNGIIGAGSVYTLIAGSEKVFNAPNAIGKAVVDVSKLRVKIGVGQVLGIRGSAYQNALTGQSVFQLASGGTTYNGLGFRYSIKSEVVVDSSKVNALQTSLSDKLSSSFVNAYVSSNFSDWTLTGATASNNVLSIEAGQTALHSLIFWSNKRQNSFRFTPTTLGVLALQWNTGQDGTSLFTIDTLNNTFNFTGFTPMSFPTNTFVVGVQYQVDILFYERMWYINIWNFRTMETKNITVDSKSIRINGGMQNKTTIICNSGAFTVEKVITSVKSNVFVLFVGDSITADYHRIPNDGNFSTILSQHYGNCAIAALPGGTDIDFPNIEVTEVSFMKPKYISYHWGVNGVYSAARVQHMIDYALSIGAIPIINNTICTRNNNHVITRAVLEAILVGDNAKYRGSYSDIATAKDNIPEGTVLSTEWGAGTRANPSMYPSSGGIVTDVHPSATGHAAIATRYLKDVKIV